MEWCCIRLYVIFHFAGLSGLFIHTLIRNFLLSDTEMSFTLFFKIWDL